MRARAASALHYALDMDAFDAAAESIYEANAAVEDPDLVRQIVRGALAANR